MNLRATIEINFYFALMTAVFAIFCGCSHNNTDNKNCGDGFLDPGEECDDGTDNSNENEDACRENCKMAHCGDGIKDSFEICDDGNTSYDDTCVQGCVPATCGDGFVYLGTEECDDAADNSDTLPDACRTDCRAAYCGDGVTDNGEQCDNGAQNSDEEKDTCRTTCLRSYCGDGVTDTGEECDDGNDDDADGCTRLCQSMKFTVGAFEADYYSNATLVHSETVETPALHYSYSELRGIDSKEFKGVWKGPLEVNTKQAQDIDIYFSHSPGSVTLTVDNQVVGTYDSSATVRQTFSPGAHDIVIEFDNNWHTTTFYTAFSQQPFSDKEAASRYLKSLMQFNPKLLYVSGLRSEHRYLNVQIDILASNAPMILFLPMFEPAIFKIDNQTQQKLLAIVYSSIDPRSTMVTDQFVPQIGLENAKDLDYTYEDDFAAPIADVIDLTGREPDYLFSEYNLEKHSIDLAKTNK